MRIHRRCQMILFFATLVLSLLAGSPESGSSRAHAQETGDGAVEGRENPFPGRFPAPSLDGGTAWLNTSAPISLQELRGKIVLLDFWTYCCINCIHILPDLKYLEQKYADQLVVIGVHSAKFENEKDSDNIREAILRYEIEHPVVNDSNMVIARKYQFNSWPTLVLIDPEGNFVGAQPGEGHRQLFDDVIGQLVTFHRAKGTLDEGPFTFHLEREKEEVTPLRFPSKLLVDDAGERLFISDSNYNRVIITTLGGEILDIIGNGQIGSTDGSYEEASFDHPHGMVLHGDTLYLADTENHMIREIDLVQKKVSTLAGTGVQAHFRSAGGPLRETPLNSPWDLEILDGVMYIAMAGPHQLWSHTLGSNEVAVFSGSGREDITDGPHATATLAQPSGIVTDGNVLYHVDSEGSAVRKVDPDPKGKVVTVVGPHDLPRARALFEFGDRDGIGDRVRLQHPIGLTYHDGLLYVADSYNHKIKVVDPKKRSAKSWIGTGKRGKEVNPPEMSEPSGLVVAGSNMFIADTNNHRILKVDMESLETSEFIIQGLEAPAAPVQQTPPSYQGPVAIEGETQVKAGERITFQIDFELPADHKLNPLASVQVQLTGSADQELIDLENFKAQREVSEQEKSVEISVPLQKSEGAAVFTLTVSYQYCRDGTGGVCRLGEQRWEIPVTVTSDGADRILLKTGPAF